MSRLATWGWRYSERVLKSVCGYGGLKSMVCDPVKDSHEEAMALLGRINLRIRTESKVDPSESLKSNWTEICFWAFSKSNLYLTDSKSSLPTVISWSTLIPSSGI